MASRSGLRETWLGHFILGWPALQYVRKSFFRPAGATSFFCFHPWLAPWAAFLRRFAANKFVVGRAIFKLAHL